MLTDQRAEAIFKEMDELVLELASDPGSLGPQYFQDMIATCRNYLNRVGLVLTELNRERLWVSSEVRKLEAVYELERDELLSNDSAIKELGSSIEDRKAAVGWRLRESRAVLTQARARLHSLNAVYKVVAFRNKELHATMTAIRDQKRLMTSEIRSGSFYGDERPSARSGDDDGGGVTPEELAAMMADDSHLDAPASSVTNSDATADSLSPTGVESATGDEVARFLQSDSGDSDTQTPDGSASASTEVATEEDELDEILDKL